MGSKIIITKYGNAIVSALHDGKRIIRLDIDAGKDDIFDNICIGKVRNIVKNINAAFVEINDGIVCYLALAKNTNPIFIKHGNSDSIKVGDELLVRVSGDMVKTKAPTCTTDIELTGKYLVLVKNAGQISVSSKIEGTAQRKRYKALVEPYVTENSGFIVRTNAMNAEDDAIVAEAISLNAEYTELLNTAAHKQCFSVVRRAFPEYICSVRDGYSDQIDEIVTDDDVIYGTLKEYLELHQPEDICKLRRYSSEFSLSLDDNYGIGKCITGCTHEKVWLKSGGSIVIQHTEALTAIDVNTEKAIKGKADTQLSFKKINLEAAEEIAYQLRLRNITGIIIVDFIDMTDPANRRELMERLSELVKPDPIKTAVIDMTGLNLVEITRKKTRKPVREQLFLLSENKGKIV